MKKLKKLSNKMKIPIVDEQDNILSYKDYYERNRQNEITRVSSISLINEKGEFLIAKRSKNKSHFPNRWGPSAAGYVEEEETYEDNIRKEVQEEIGINLQNVIHGPKVRGFDDHQYFSQYFFATIPSSTKFTLDESEVAEVRWISLGDLKAWYSKSPEEFTPNTDRRIKVLEKYENQS